MAIYKRPDNPDGPWQIRFEHRGRTYRKSSGTLDKRLAERAERKFKEQVYRRVTLGEKSYTWEDGVKKWMVEKAHKRSLLRDRQISDWFGELFAGLNLDDINDDSITDAKRALNASKSSPGTRNRYLAWLRSFLRACRKWRMVGEIPVIEIPKVPRPFVPSLSREMVARVFAALSPHLRPVALFALSTGLRRGNVLGLRWERVNLSQRTVVVPGSERKQGSTHTVQLNDQALTILEAQRGMHPTHVFPDHKGRAPIKNIKTGWNAACRRAGVAAVANLKGTPEYEKALEDALQAHRIQFRKLRRTWATWHALNKTPPQVIKELGGWQTMAMVELYTEEAGNFAADWANNVRAEIA
jgi:integrase